MADRKHSVFSTPDVAVVGRVETAIGKFGVALTSQGIGRLTFPSERPTACVDWVSRWLPDTWIVNDEAALGSVAEELTAYFDGALRQFTVPLDLRGTPFQLRVWQAVQRIEYGCVQTYQHIAAAIQNPQAVRAVGAANGANPVPIIVPCHRIIGSNGKLVGYGGGLALKHRLLKLEGVML